MMPLPHHYHVQLTGGPSGHAELATDNVPSLRAASPVEYDGPGDAWSPEHLLLASVEACFLFTLRALARHSKVEFTALEVDASGTVDREDGITRFTEIVMRPRITLPAGADRERALHVLEKSKKVCLVSASLSTPVRLEPEIAYQGDELAASLRARQRAGNDLLPVDS
jgi:peroxiredoxin-like protein